MAVNGHTKEKEDRETNRHADGWEPDRENCGHYDVVPSHFCFPPYLEDNDSDKTTQEEEQMFCSQCGRKLQQYESICAQCGGQTQQEPYSMPVKAVLEASQQMQAAATTQQEQAPGRQDAPQLRVASAPGNNGGKSSNRKILVILLAVIALVVVAGVLLTIWLFSREKPAAEGGAGSGIVAADKAADIGELDVPDADEATEEPAEPDTQPDDVPQTGGLGASGTITYEGEEYSVSIGDVSLQAGGTLSVTVIAEGLGGLTIRDGQLLVPVHADIIVGGEHMRWEQVAAENNELRFVFTTDSMPDTIIVYSENTSYDSSEALEFDADGNRK